MGVAWHWVFHYFCLAWQCTLSLSIRLSVLSVRKTSHTSPSYPLEPPVEEREREKEKASLEFVEKSYQELNSKKIKDSLSSFLADIPGQILSPSLAHHHSCVLLSPSPQANLIQLTLQIQCKLNNASPPHPSCFMNSPPSSSFRLRHLIDHRPIGGKEFLPLSGQALLGFRLLPGAVRITVLITTSIRGYSMTV